MRLIFGLMIALALPIQAQASCRQALALGLDVSGSVDSFEYRLQVDGLAGALQRPEVQQAFLTFPEAPVRLFVYEWAGQDSRRILYPWTEITSADVLSALSTTLRATPRLENEPATAIGEAMLFGARALLQQNDCWRRTLDLSGDGKSNVGIRPRDLRNAPHLGDITINGLIVGSDALSTSDRRQAEIADLWAYFKIEVIRGPQAFVEVAVGFDDFEDAMARKLLKELQTLAVSALPSPGANDAAIRQ